MSTRVITKLLEYGQQLATEDRRFTQDREANELVFREPFAFLCGVTMNQNLTAERVWETPLQLRGQLGHLDPHEMASMTREELADAIRQLPRRPRFPVKFAGYLIQAARMVVERFEGRADRIWMDRANAGDVIARFDSFPGIGQKKATMATNILYRKLRVPMENANEIDVSYDRHMRRVFKRTGLAQDESEREVILAARRANPDYPGALDLPAWKIGRQWCRPSMPDCASCVLGEVCPKVI